MNTRWPVLAQVLIALGVGGGVISMWVGFSQKDWMLVALGIVTAAIFWSFYQIRPWALNAVKILLIVLIASDVLTVVLKMVTIPAGIIVIIFRSLILYYFNTPEIKAMFDTEPKDT